jgi:hypothetical protein
MRSKHGTKLWAQRFDSECEGLIVRTTKTTTRLVQLARLGSHTLMGIAMGLAFALVTIRAEVFGIRVAIEQSDLPAAWLNDFVMTCAMAFGVLATLTGVILTSAEG